MFDFRSDTVTRPTKDMKEAMISAEVGDDVYEDDLTIKKLEQIAAQITGFESSLFVLSGTMGNQLAVMTHTQKGEAVLMHDHVHVNQFEVGAIGLLSGVYPQLVKNEIGFITSEDILKNHRLSNIHFPKVSTMIVENALGDGRCLNSTIMKQTIKQAHDFGYKVHMDGARLFNAHVAIQEPLSDLIDQADSLMFCLSKGLGAPVGSMLCGNKEFIAQARRYRKMLGGGIRQGGILAGAGIYALNHHVDRLKEDHRRAEIIASMLQNFGYEIKINHRDINMVFFKLKKNQGEIKWIEDAHNFGLIFGSSTHGWLRLVTHLDINDEAINNFQQFLFSQN